MEPFPYIVLLVLIVVLPFMIIRHQKEKEKWNKRLENLAKAHNLTFIKGSLGKGPEISGTIGGFPICVLRRDFSHGKSSTATIGFLVDFKESREQFQITAENFLSRLKKTDRKTDIELDDRSFDDAALVKGGSTHAVRALLHPEARRIITQLIESSYDRKFSLSENGLETYQRTGQFMGEATIYSEIRSIIRLAQLLTRKKTTEELLRENYLAESVIDCRIKYLESLSAVVGGMTEKDVIIQDALRSGNHKLAFHAVKAIGKAGYRYIPDIFSEADENFACQILDYAGKTGATSLVLFFKTTFPNIKSWPIKSAVVRFLASTRDPSIESFLHEQLAAQQNHPIEHTVECIKALGRCGTYDSIQVLHSLRDSWPRREIDGAIASIQARIGTGDAGWLSIHESKDGEGNLSLNEDDEE